VKKSAMKRCNLGCQQSNENLSGLLAYTEEIREERSWIGRKTHLQFKAKFPDPRRRTEKRSARCLLESGPGSAGKARKEGSVRKDFKFDKSFIGMSFRRYSIRFTAANCRTSSIRSSCAAPRSEGRRAQRSDKVSMIHSAAGTIRLPVASGAQITVETK
jgi:hypothetical protein